QIDQFLKAIAQRQLLLEQADSARVTLSPDDWRQIREEHDSTIATLTAILNLTPEVLRDSAGPSSQSRVNFAAESRSTSGVRFRIAVSVAIVESCSSRICR